MRLKHWMLTLDKRKGINQHQITLSELWWQMHILYILLTEIAKSNQTKQKLFVYETEFFLVKSKMAFKISSIQFKALNWWLFSGVCVDVVVWASQFCGHYHFRPHIHTHTHTLSCFLALEKFILFCALAFFHGISFMYFRKSLFDVWDRGRNKQIYLVLYRPRTKTNQKYSKVN